MSRIRIWKWFSLLFDLIPFSPTRQKTRTFYRCLFAMIGKIVSVDGTTSREEKHTLDRFMHDELELSAAEKILALKIFSKARASSIPFLHFAEEFHQSFSWNKHILKNVIDLLLQFSFSDGALCKKEEALILEAVRLFKISPAAYERMKKFHAYNSEYEKRQKYGRSDYTGRKDYGTHQQAQSSFKDPYAILGVIPTDSNDKIKRKYRLLARECHPDMLSAKGVPESVIKNAEKKFILITEAYEKISEMRGGL